MALKFMEKEQNRYIKRLHTLFGRLGIDNSDKMALYAGYGVTTSRDMNIHDLLDLCDKLSSMMSPEARLKEKWMKRLMAIVGKYLKETCHEPTTELVKSVIKRAAKADRLANIPTDRLRSLYNAFNNRYNDLKRIDKITIDLLTNNDETKNDRP